MIYLTIRHRIAFLLASTSFVAIVQTNSVVMHMFASIQPRQFVGTLPPLGTARRARPALSVMYLNVRIMLTEVHVETATVVSHMSTEQDKSVKLLPLLLLVQMMHLISLVMKIMMPSTVMTSTLMTLKMKSYLDQRTLRAQKSYSSMTLFNSKGRVCAPVSVNSIFKT